MKIIVEDTNIIIDLFNTGLLQFCKKMDIEFHTTDLVIKEIKRPEQRSTLKGLISNEELKMVVFNIEEMLQLANLEEECRSTNNLSTADCSVVLLAEMFGASKEVVLSLAPKAVTTPIAMEISASIGGIPPLTAAVVVCTGIFGGLAL